MPKRKWSGAVTELSDGRRAVDEFTIYLAKLPKHLESKKQVAEALQEFGEVVHVHIKEDLSHGFVHFASKDSAAAAIRAGSVGICHRQVEIRSANQDANQDPPPNLLEGESSFYWQGRLEKFRRGHGFLRPLPGGEQLPEMEHEDVGIERGVYVSVAQVERFDLQDGDVIGAEVRPPRSSSKRSYNSSCDEVSWALLQLRDINGEQASARDRGWSWSAWSDKSGSPLEWTGVVECWRKLNHGFLRPLPPEDRRSINNPDVDVAQGVFVYPKTIQDHRLRDGDVVKAQISTSEGKSMVVRRVLHVDRKSEDILREKAIALEGYGFLRPLPDDLELWQEKGCSEGVYVAASQISRYGIYHGQRVTGLIYPAAPPAKPSPELADILPDKPEDVWQLLEKDSDENGPPLKIRRLLGLRMHGVITSWTMTKSGFYGFLKADHVDIPDEVFFRVWHDPKQLLQLRLGEAVFFRLEIRRRGEGDWTCCAANLHFHEQDGAREHQPKDLELLKAANAWLETVEIPRDQRSEIHAQMPQMAAAKAAETETTEAAETGETAETAETGETADQNAAVHGANGADQKECKDEVEEMKETTKMEKEKELEKKQIESPEQAGSAPRRKPSRPKLKPQRSSVAQPRPKDGGRFERPIPVIGPSRVIPGQLGQRQGEPRPGEPATRPIQAMKSMANSNIHITFTMPASKAKALPKKQVLPKKLLPTSKPLAKPRGSVAHHMDALTSPPPKPQIRPTRAKPKAKPKAAPKASAGSEQLSKTAKKKKQLIQQTIAKVKEAASRALRVQHSLFRKALSERNALKGKDMDQILEEATKLLPSSLSELEEAKPATRKLPTKVAPQAPPAPPPPTPPPPPPAPTARSGATPTAAPAAAFSASAAPARTPHSAAKAKPAPKMMPRSKPETQKRVKLEDPGDDFVTVRVAGEEEPSAPSSHPRQSPPARQPRSDDFVTVKLEDDDFVTVKVEGAEDTRATSSRDAVMVKVDVWDSDEELPPFDPDDNW
ncbi:unnamed protein product [Durusdinium trenchii]|uniref:RRM domain-containing protein n=1 Tax=Durusdinium trenchii TaxID=1381693 RepID=A0ABP0N9G1_9DINO